MISKKNRYLLHKLAFIEGVVGAARSGMLTGQEADALRQHYGLDEDANLVMRNAGRGIAGAAVGTIGGALVGNYVGKLAKTPGLGKALGALGFIGGTILGTNKYSQGNAQDIMQQQNIPQ